MKQMVLGLSQLVNEAAHLTHLTTEHAGSSTKTQGHHQMQALGHFNAPKRSERDRTELIAQETARKTKRLGETG